MNLIHESFARLFPGREFPYQTELEYNLRLGRFNANILKHGNTISVRMNLQWKDINDEIKIGLIQHLLLKIFKEKGHTFNVELYNNFIKNIPSFTAKTRADPSLESSFQRINAMFFSNKIEKPNLVWGKRAFHKLASYNLYEDTITVSEIFKDARQEVLNYLMYHEMLHKHFQFRQRNGRNFYHSRDFRKAERLYPEYKEIENELHQIIRQKRRKPVWGLF